MSLQARRRVSNADPGHPQPLLQADTACAGSSRSGTAVGEAIGLRWSDVDLGPFRISVEQQIVAVGATSHVGPPKTSRGRRTFALPPMLADALRWHLARQRLERLTAGDRWVDTGLLFTDVDGAALVPGAVSRHFDQLTRAAGLPAIRLHDLRHTSASQGLASGESLIEVSRRLGHSSITITADVYSHVAPATARGSAERLTLLISEAAASTPPD